MSKPRILCFAGSARQQSFNQSLVKIGAELAHDAGAETTVLNLKDYPLPIFDQDVEAEGTPENATKLKQLFLEHDGLLLGCPEYNSSITPMLKNVLDWVSRSSEGESPLAAYQGKVAGLVATSPGALGGMRGLVHVRAILSSIGVTVIPAQVAVSKAHEVLKDGKLVDERASARLKDMVEALVAVTAKLTS